MNRRKNFFINKDFQSRFILRFVITATAWSAAAATLFALLSLRKIEEIAYSSHINIRSSVELLAPAAWVAHTAALLLFAGLLFLTIHSLWKRLSAPLYSIKKDIARVSAGDLVSVINVREGEEFQDLASEIDQMRRDLGKKFLRLKEEQAALSAAATALTRAGLKGTLSSGHVTTVQDATAKVKEVLNVFTF